MKKHQDHFSSVRKQIFFSSPKGLREGPSQQDLGPYYRELFQLQNNSEQVYPNSVRKDQHTRLRKTDRTLKLATFYPGPHWITAPTPYRKHTTEVLPALPIPLVTDSPGQHEEGKKKKRLEMRGCAPNHQFSSETYKGIHFINQPGTGSQKTPLEL